MKNVFFFIAALMVGQAATADYYDLAKQKVAQEAANDRAAAWSRVQRWNAGMNSQIMGAVQTFAGQHRGFATEPQYTYSEYGDYGTDIKVQDHISRIVFSTHDGYQCKADWGLLYNAEVHLQVNCINSVTGKEINLYPKTKSSTR